MSAIPPVTFSAFLDEFQKIAEEEKKPSKGWQLAKILGSGALGFGVGTAAGMGTGYIADKIYEKATGNKIPKPLVLGAAPLLGGAAGIAYSVYKAKEQEAMRRALEDQASSRAR